jgi:hypothetical protein
MTTFHNDIVGSNWAPPLPSACLSCDTTHWAIRGWPVHYPNAHLQRNGGVSSTHYNPRATSVYQTPYIWHAVIT